MSDESAEDAESEEHEGTERDSEEYEVGRFVTREEGAAALRRFADGVANGSVELGDDGITVSVPERFDLEIEYEQESEEAELDVELEWSIGDGGAVAAEQGSGARGDDDRGGTETEETDEQEELGEASESAAKIDAGSRIDEVVGVGDAASSARFELYRDRADEWRWRLVHDNGNIIADSGEGYDRRATARNGLESVMRNAPGADIVETDD